jgi:hypothetical protein
MSVKKKSGLTHIQHREPNQRSAYHPAEPGNHNVRQLAEGVRATGQLRLERFALTDDDVWGLGCDGVIDLFVEPVDDQSCPCSMHMRPAPMASVWS